MVENQYCCVLCDDLSLSRSLLSVARNQWRILLTCCPLFMHKMAWVVFYFIASC
jgi:hypothetical protein